MHKIKPTPNASINLIRPSTHLFVRPSRLSTLLLALLLLHALVACGVARDQLILPNGGGNLARFYALPGPYKVETFTAEPRDERRNRVVPIRAYQPVNAPGLRPAILFSHGLGGSRDGYEFLGRQWASHGFVVIHLQHVGSDSAILREGNFREKMQALKRAVRNPRAAINRPLDISFLIDELERQIQAKGGRLEGKVDLDRIGLGGHSFGAWTTLASAGQRFFQRGQTRSFGDQRIRAAIAMSPSPGRNQSHWDKAFTEIGIPMMHQTGTHDTSRIAPEVTAESRRVPFDKITARDQFLIIFQDGDHMIFSQSQLARLMPRKKHLDAYFHPLILASTTAFWKAYLEDDADAKSWLINSDGLRAALGQRAATYQFKRVIE